MNSALQLLSGLRSGSFGGRATRPGLGCREFLGSDKLVMDHGQRTWSGTHAHSGALGSKSLFLWSFIAEYKRAGGSRPGACGIRGGYSHVFSSGSLWCDRLAGIRLYRTGGASSFLDQPRSDLVLRPCGGSTCSSVCADAVTFGAGAHGSASMSVAACPHRFPDRAEARPYQKKACYVLLY